MVDKTSQSVAWQSLRKSKHGWSIYDATQEAASQGFYNGHPDWCNLGQGQPEVGPIEGGTERISHMAISVADYNYANFNGIPELREAVAAHYNRLYRRGRKSLYSAENVAIAGGGRLMLSRLFSCLANLNLGYRVPDYAGYAEIMDAEHHHLTPVLLSGDAAGGFSLSAEAFDGHLRKQGLGAFVCSNPCNPTGQLLSGDELANYVNAGRRHKTLMIFDEFYSQFIYSHRVASGQVSAAAYVEDVNRDPVVLIDGMTKSFRCPGWRIGWAVGPRDVIDALGRRAAALDGGAAVPLQRAAVAALTDKFADREGKAMRTLFVDKRNSMINALEEIGVQFPYSCEGTFYLFGSVADLPEPFCHAEVFYREALKHRVIVVPGKCFDINPGGRRRVNSDLDTWVRFSFGPSQEVLQEGCRRLATMLTT